MEICHAIKSHLITSHWEEPFEYIPVLETEIHDLFEIEDIPFKQSPAIYYQAAIERFASAHALNLKFQLSNFMCTVTLYPLEGFCGFVHLFLDPIFVDWHKCLHLFLKADSGQFSISQALVREDIGSEGSINAGLSCGFVV